MTKEQLENLVHKLTISEHDACLILAGMEEHYAKTLVSGNEANQSDNKKDGEVALPVSDAVDFFKWTNKHFWKGMNGYIPFGWSAYASGKTIEEIYAIFKNETGNDR